MVTRKESTIKPTTPCVSCENTDYVHNTHFLSQSNSNYIAPNMCTAINTDTTKNDNSEKVTHFSMIFLIVVETEIK